MTFSTGASDDDHWMRAALAWAQRGRGLTSPRPSVGSVLVRDGRLLGGGHTQPGDGNPHAEVMALREAGAQPGGARGATCYATLEPCSHWGTTPPCCDALIAAGVERVVVGVSDPNPVVAGQGFSRLLNAGIEVVTGVLEAECFRAHDDFLKTIVTGTPFVTLKAAASLDGKTALPSGESKWITGVAAREEGHRLRHQHDAVLVGIGTVLADDPQLSVRLPGLSKQPVRVVLDRHARLPLDARLWQETARVVVFVSSDAPRENVGALMARGAQVLVAPVHNPWPRVLAQLFELQVNSVLIEGGAHVAGSALEAGVVDKIVVHLAPVLIGEGLGLSSGWALERLEQAPRLERVWVERLGNDILVGGYLPPPGEGAASSTMVPE